MYAEITWNRQLPGILLVFIDLYMIGLMKLQLQMFVQDRVDETTDANVCIGQG